MFQRQKKIQPVFHEIPKWLGAYRNHGLTTNSPQFHYYSARDQLSQPVTLYVSSEEDRDCRPITMYYNIEHDQGPSMSTNKDESQLKDFSYLQVAEKQEHQKLSISKQEVTKESSWVKKYEPKRFFDLLSDQLINRNVLSWLKSWDEIVFKKKIQKAEPTNTLFRRANTNRSNFIYQQFNYKKLILLAGPPGCGKTTLARVVARHCGYHWEEINASDDRSAKALITKIDNLATNKTVGREQKPVCIIIDEVDGALDNDSNGIKQVLQYLETGVNPDAVKIQKKEKDPKKKGKPEPKVLIDKGDQAKIEKDQRKTKIDRPVIFICNDPFVRGLKELRGRALVVFFNQLQQDRVVKRLKEITELQNIYIESDLLSKISQMCNNDVRSSVGILQLISKFKRQQGLAPKQVLNRLKFSFSKDAVTSTNQFLQKLNSSKFSEKELFSKYQYFLEQHGNPSLLFETFCHNLSHHKQVFLRLEGASRLYRQLVNYDVKINENHGQTDQFAMLPYLFFRISFKPDEQRKIQFPSIYFQKIAKMRNNHALLEKIMKGVPPYLRIFSSSRQFAEELLYMFWLIMQTSSAKEEDILRCVYAMLTYGIKLAPRGGPNIFSPQIDQFLTFGESRPEIALSSTTRNLMQENYQFLKMKSQLISQPSADNRQNYQKVINQLKRNRRRNRQLLGGGEVKYKYLEGTGTEIKYDITIGNFFQPKTTI